MEKQQPEEPSQRIDTVGKSLRADQHERLRCLIELDHATVDGTTGELDRMSFKERHLIAPKCDVVLSKIPTSLQSLCRKNMPNRVQPATDDQARHIVVRVSELLGRGIAFAPLGSAG